MPEARKATLKQMLSAEVKAALEQRPDLRLVKLADGARDNWSYLGELAPQAEGSDELVDFIHAAEQLKAATDAAYGENDLWDERNTRSIAIGYGMSREGWSG